MWGNIVDSEVDNMDDDPNFVNSDESVSENDDSFYNENINCSKQIEVNNKIFIFSGDSKFCFN